MPFPVKYFTIDPAELSQNIDGQVDTEDNPFANLTQEFFDELQSISSIELAQSSPYISLFTVNLNGEIIEDLNVSYFFNAQETDSIDSQIRYKNRPTMSFDSIDLITRNPSGDIYISEVVMKLKIHSLTELSKTSLISLVIPGSPHLLEYGWKSPNEFLNSNRESVYFQVRNYTLNYNEVSEVDLTIYGTVLAENFKNTLVGDVGEPIETENISNEEADGINHKKQRIEKLIESIEELKNSSGQNTTNPQIARLSAEAYNKNENIAREVINISFNQKMEKLRELVDPSTGNVTLHDLIYTLCNDTFVALTDIWPKVDEFRIIYGSFNKTLDLASVPRSLADFPINYKRFVKKIENSVERGDFALNIQRLINLLVTEFLSNEEVWRANIDSTDAETYNSPYIRTNFFNRSRGNDGHVLEYHIFDAKAFTPSTLASLPEGKTSPEEFEESVVQNNITPLGIIRLGHAQSFVKKTELQQVVDESMKSVLIERMAQDRLEGPRSTKTKNRPQARGVQPLTLPLEGNLEVIGHPAWKPFKSFYIDAGLFLINGAYLVLETTHTLRAGDFTTRLKIRYA